MLLISDDDVSLSYSDSESSSDNNRYLSKNKKGQKGTFKREQAQPMVKAGRAALVSI
jgi:hypothetical protein